MKTVKYRFFYRELMDLNQKIHGEYGFKASRIDASNVRIGVNIPTITIPPEEALKFAEQLKDAAEEVAKFKYNGFKVDYTLG